MRLTVYIWETRMCTWGIVDFFHNSIGDVKRGFALWKKQYIVFSGPVPRPPTPPGSSPHVQQGPHEPQGPSTTPAGSPHEQQWPSTPRGCSPHEQQVPSTTQKLPSEKTDEEALRSYMSSSPHLPEVGPSASPPRLPPHERAPVNRNGSPPRKMPRLERTQPLPQKANWTQRPSLCG